jgi:uncharacterized protein (TIGR00255 family)
MRRSEPAATNTTLLLSMTGFGTGRYEEPGFHATVEVRTVNHRYSKVVTRTTDPYSIYEGEIEREVRKRVARGTVYVIVRVERRPVATAAALRLDVLRQYLDQLLPIAAEYNLPVTVGEVLSLPGVITDQAGTLYDPMEDWPKVRGALLEALEKVNAMRRQEGAVMAEELRRLADQITRELDQIEARAPVVVENYRSRLQERLRQWFGEQGPEFGLQEIAREVALFADRADIREEIVRLRCHLKQFRDLLGSGRGDAGRKLEFLGQEMLREANTIAAKANDVEISQRVVEIKATVEKVRELVQNIE